jgi:hypothetical protein
LRTTTAPIPAILLLGSLAPAWATAPPVICRTTPTPDSPPTAYALGPAFASEVLAVTAAANAYNPASVRDDREYMGGILTDGRQYYYTATAGVAGQDKVQARIRIPAGLQLVAFWHTHGAPAHERRFFSDVDTELANRWGLPFYLADPTGALRVYMPRDPLLSAQAASRLGLPARHGFARGRDVEDGFGRRVRVQPYAGTLTG